MDPAIVEAFASRGLDWVIARLHRLDPTQDWLPDTRLRFKIFAETLFLATQLQRNPLFKHDERVAELCAFLCNVEQRYDVAGLVRSDPTGLTTLALVEELEQLQGRGKTAGAAELRRLLAAGYSQSMERLPFRRMDARYCFDRISQPSDCPSLRDLFRRTPAGNTPWLPALTTADLYSITHTIFYITDMGFQQATSILSPPEVNHLCWLSQTLLGMVVRDRDLDLIGEFLMSCAALRIPGSLAYRTGWKALVAGQRPDGAIPHRLLETVHTEGLPEAEQERRIFPLLYHTTFVGIMAALIHCRIAPIAFDEEGEAARA